MDIGWMKDGYRMTEAGVLETCSVSAVRRICLSRRKTGKELGFGG